MEKTIFTLSICIALGVLSALGANIAKNGSFENDLQHWNDLAQCLQPKMDYKNYKSGQKSVSFVVKPSKNIYLRQSLKHNVKVKKYNLSGWVKKNNVKNCTPDIMGIAVYLDGSKYKYKYFCAASTGVNEKGWQLRKISFTVPERTVAVRILLKSSSGKSPSGTILFDDIKLEEQIPNTNKLTIQDIKPEGAMGVFKLGENVSLDINLINSFLKQKTIKLKITLKDYYNKEIFKKNDSVKVEGLSKAIYKLKLPPQNKQGFYAVCAEVYDSEGTKTKNTASFSVVKPIEKADTFFGLTPYGIIPAGELGYRAARAIGAGTVGIIFWGSIEYQNGKYNWRLYDKQLEYSLKNNLKVIGSFYMGGDHSTRPLWMREEFKKRKALGKNPYTEKYYQDSADFEYQTIKRYRKDIKEWSAIEEIDLAMHIDKYEKNHYIKRVRNLYKTMKKVNPEFVLGGIGVTGNDGVKNPRFPAAKLFFKELGDSIDYMAYDPYIEPKMFGPGHNPIGPEKGKFREMLLASLSLAKKYGKQHIAIDEKGYPIVSALPVDSIYAKQLAEVLARAYVIARSIPENKYWLYFIFQGAFQGKGDYGMWRLNCPRPSVSAYATVARRLAHVSKPLMLKIHKDIYCFVFQKGTGSVVALWTLADKPISFKFNMPCKYKLYDIMNNAVEKKIGSQKLKISKSVVFIESEESSLNIARELKHSKYFLPELKADISLRSLSAISIYLRNESSKTINVELKVKDFANIKLKNPRRTISLKAGKSKRLKFTILNGTFEKLQKAECILEATVNKHQYKFVKLFDLIGITRLKSPASIDADLCEFTSIKAIKLDGVDYLHPVDAIANRLWTGKADLSSKVYLAYDDKNFYFAAEVRDDFAVNGNKSSKIWANDAFQMAFDTNNSALPQNIAEHSGYGINDYEFAFGLTPVGAQLYCHKAALKNIRIQDQVLAARMIAVKRIGSKTIYELAIPWKALYPLKAVNGKAFGFNFINLDSDIKGQNAKYWMGLTPGIANGKQPEHFKTFILLP
jgi:cellulose/xylan binding protein with CBM9 domain/carbohydrate binding protein with CBM4/9 domain